VAVFWGSLAILTATGEGTLRQPSMRKAEAGVTPMANDRQRDSRSHASAGLVPRFGCIAVAASSGSGDGAPFGRSPIVPSYRSSVTRCGGHQVTNRTSRHLPPWSTMKLSTCVSYPPPITIDSASGLIRLLQDITRGRSPVQNRHGSIDTGPDRRGGIARLRSSP
jgi:hypothetical protein